MELNTAIELIKHPALTSNQPAAWADLGCGSGLFTHALSTLLAKDSAVYAIDSNASALKRVTVMANIVLKTFALDFTHDELPFDKVDAIMMANSLHYVKDKEGFIGRLKGHLTNSGLLLVVEYDTTRANNWVPYPVTFAGLSSLLYRADFSDLVKLGETPSAFRQGSIYAALAKL